MAQRICNLTLRVPQAQCLVIKSRVIPWYMSSWFMSLWDAQINNFSHKFWANFFLCVSTLYPQSNHFPQQLFLVIISSQILLNTQNSRHFCAMYRSRILKTLCSHSFVVKFKLLDTDYFSTDQILGIFSVACLVCLSPSAWNNLAPNGWIFMQFHILGLLKNCQENSSVIKIWQD
jgi:hypothetical protein